MKLTRSRYQQGTVELRKRRLGESVWVYRFAERMEDGESRRRSVPLGTQSKYPTKSAATRAAAYWRERANESHRLESVKTISMAIERFKAEELSDRHSTRRSALVWLDHYVGAKWGKLPLEQIRAMEVRAWLRDLPLSGKSKGHIHGLMRQLFNAAMLWEWFPLQKNPMTLFRIEGSSMRTRKPIVLGVESFIAILDKIKREPFRTMVLTAMCIGPRRSEFIALKWLDFNWEKREVYIRRGIVDGVIGPVKTQYSESPMPLEESFVEVLLRWRRISEFADDEDWVFASPYSAGDMPYWPGGVNRNYLRKAGQQLGLGNVGWHSLRHTYRAWLDHVGAPPSVQQWLMRHSDIRTTMNIYGRAMPAGMREANSKVVNMVLRPN